MKNKFALLAVAAACVALFTGCASMEVNEAKNLNGEAISYSGKPVAHINATNWGLYFFMFPVLTGSVDNPGTAEWFKDTVTVANMAKYVTAKSKELKASQTLDMTTTHTVPGWFFFIKDVQMSANVVQ